MLRMAVPTQPRVVPVTVYVVVIVGLQATNDPVVTFRPTEGDQLYVAAPEAVMDVTSPLQMEVDAGVTVSTGTGLTVIVCRAFPEQPADVPVMVYVVVVVASQFTNEPAVALNPDEGDQL